MNLLLLAPDLQEHLLLSPTTVEERRLRNVVKIVEWREQRKCFTIALDQQTQKDRPFRQTPSGCLVKESF
jgi:hypothetical protein